MEDETVDRKNSEAVRKYEEAVREYEKKVLEINEYSLVKTEMKTPFGSFVCITWIVFSNIYLSNSRSFPDLDIPSVIDAAFEERYKSLVEKHMHIVAKPKKFLGITEKMEFYYPCSEMFAIMKGKRAGDEVSSRVGVKYRILKVINPNTD